MSDSSDAASSNGDWEQVELDNKSVDRQKSEQDTELVKCRQELEEERERSRRLNEEVEKMRAEVANMKVAENKDKEETLLEKVDVLLKALTGTNKMEVIDKFISLKVSSSAEDLKEVINAIAKNVIQKPALASLYVELCKYQVASDVKKNKKDSPFRKELFNDFQRRNTSDENIGNTDDEAYKLGISTFVAYSYSIGLVSHKLVYWSIFNYSVFALMNYNRQPEGVDAPHRYNEFNLQCVARMLTIAGTKDSFADKYVTEFFDHTLIQLEEVAPLCSDKTRDILERLQTLRPMLVQKEKHRRSGKEKASAKKQNCSSSGIASAGNEREAKSKTKHAGDVAKVAKKDTHGENVPATGKVRREYEETLLEQVEFLLNSLTEANKKEVFKEFVSYEVSVFEELKEIINIIISNAIYNPDLTSIYAELCKYQVDYEMRGNVTLFHDAFLDNLQRRSIEQSDDDIYKLGITAFITLAYSHGLVTVNIIQWSIDDVLKHTETTAQSPLSPSNESNLQCVARMLTGVGEMVESDNTRRSFKGTNYIDKTMNRLQRLAPSCSVQTRCMFASLAMLRARNWVPLDLMPDPADNIRMNFAEACAKKATKIYDDDYDLWIRILDEYCIKVVSTGVLSTMDKGTADGTICWAPPPADKKEGDGWEKMRKVVDKFRGEGTNGKNGGKNVQTTDELPEIEENFIYLKPWMVKEVEQVDRSTQSLRKERVNIYKTIRRLEKARDKKRDQWDKTYYDSAIEKLKKHSATVSASVLSNNYSYVLELNLFLPEDFKDVNAGGDSGDVRTPIVLEESMDPRPWMDEEYRKVEESIGELKDKAMMIYTKMAALEYSSKRSYEGEEVGNTVMQELQQMRAVCSKMAMNTSRSNEEHDRAIVTLLKAT